jgi:uncharacterized membrane protein
VSLEPNKNLGGVGALLIVVSPLGGAALAVMLGLVGLILMLIALNGMASHYKDRKIFDYSLYGVIAAIVGVVVTTAVILLTITSTLSSMGINLFNRTTWSQIVPSLRNLVNTGSFWGLAAGLVIALVVLVVSLVVSAVLFRKSLNALSEKTKLDMFRTAGLIMLIGAALTIVVVGLILIWISFVLIAVAFFSIKTK